MIIKELSLLNYKNISQKQFVFDNKINCFVGKNGIGKTTVLDAVYHIAYGKSYFNPLATQNIKHNEDFFVIEALIQNKDIEENVLCSLKRGQKKVVKRNGKIFDKLSDYVGFMPVVMISPADVDLINDGSDSRRKFIDNIISTVNKNYLNLVITYHKILAQRNALLKYFAVNGVFDKDNLDIYDEKLIPLSKKIFEIRREFIEEFSDIFYKHHQEITNKEDNVSIEYVSDLHQENFETTLKNSLARDRVFQYTTKGIHKDDLIFNIDNHIIKKYGSQGQQKSFLIALRLAQFEFLKKSSGILPILLLDDIFDKLDEFRVKHIISMINNNTFGQIFISDTHENRIRESIEHTNKTFKIFNL